MRRKKKSDIHIVENHEDETDALIDEVLKELREEDGVQEEIDEQVRKHRKSQKTKRIIAAVLIIVVVVAMALVINLRTYTTSRVSTTYEINAEGNVSYLEFGNGVLKYSKDGIALVNRKGDEEWNQPYQIKNPIVNTWQDEAVVVADKGGNTIMVMDKKGLKGEMQTALPVERVSVSSQGIVCAVLTTNASPKLVCYDAEGNVLVELTTSLSGTGYPMDVSLSEDGKMLLVSYLSIQKGQILTKVVYYSFDGTKEKSQDYEVTSDEYPGVVAASAYYMNADTSAVVTDNSLLIYKGAEKPKLSKNITINKKIKSAFHSDKYIGLVLKNEGKGGYELCLYNKSGKKILSEDFTGDYANVKISGSQVLMYDGKKCSVYTHNGIHKYQGEVDDVILEIFPTFGVNKYIVMSANGMEVVRFVK